MADFPWGPVLAEHKIGEYEIVEFEHKTGVSAFHVSTSESGSGHSFDTLDEAIVWAIAKKYDGLNTKAHRYFMFAMLAAQAERAEWGEVAD